MTLPAPLLPFKNKLFGLSTTAEHLHAIRTKRRPNSRYSSIEQCQLEITHIENLLVQEQIPFLNAAHLSIEELSTQILAKFKLKERI
jgi:regulator of PEP synthase PpsR (kinase-PPPase family)